MEMKKWVFFMGFIVSLQALLAGPISIANRAKVSASSELNKGFTCANINDGIISVDGQGSWKAKGKEAWIMLSWEKTQLVDKIVVFNYPSHMLELKWIWNGKMGNSSLQHSIRSKT
jgi:hypothetical protein